jgi:hypothetical protein
MTVETTAAAFDVATFKQSYEQWDIEALVAMYADDVELIQIDRDNPPSASRIRHGRDMLRGMLEHCAKAGVRANVENTVAGEKRAAATITCEFPGGRKVLANAVLELRDGRIVRELDVLSGDPRGA